MNLTDEWIHCPFVRVVSTGEDLCSRSDVSMKKCAADSNRNCRDRHIVSGIISKILSLENAVLQNQTLAATIFGCRKPFDELWPQGGLRVLAALLGALRLGGAAFIFLSLPDPRAGQCCGASMKTRELHHGSGALNNML